MLVEGTLRPMVHAAFAALLLHLKARQDSNEMRHVHAKLENAFRMAYPGRSINDIQSLAAYVASNHAVSNLRFKATKTL